MAVTCILTLLGVILYGSLTDLAIENRLIYGGLYDTTLVPADNKIKFYIYPREYLRYNGDPGQGRVVFQQFDTRISLEPAMDLGEKYWISWTIETDWNVIQGKYFTLQTEKEEGGEETIFHRYSSY